MLVLYFYKVTQCLYLLTFYVFRQCQPESQRTPASLVLILSLQAMSKKVTQPFGLRCQSVRSGKEWQVINAGRSVKPTLIQDSTQSPFLLLLIVLCEIQTNRHHYRCFYCNYTSIQWGYSFVDSLAIIIETALNISCTKTERKDLALNVFFSRSHPAFRKSQHFSHP